MEIVEIFKQYKSMLSRTEKRRRSEQSRQILDQVVNNLKPGDQVIDCGANVGVVTSALAATGADVHAFEPDPVAFEVLSKTCEKFSNVTLHNAAVGVRAGTITLLRDHHFDKNPVGRTVRSTTIEGGRRMSKGDEGTVEVELVDLLDVIRNVTAGDRRIAFLKMDVEGAEVDLLEAMNRENLFDKIDLTVAETHEKKFGHLRARSEAAPFDWRKISAGQSEPGLALTPI